MASHNVHANPKGIFFKLGIFNNMVLQIIIKLMIEIGDLFEEGHRRLVEDDCRTPLKS
jgi:hypothetical protein